MLFNGTNSYVGAPDKSWLNMGTENFSIYAWVAPYALDSGSHIIVDKRQNSPLQGYSLFLYNGRLGLQLADNAGYYNYLSTTAVPADDYGII